MNDFLSYVNNKQLQGRHFKLSLIPCSVVFQSLVVFLKLEAEQLQQEQELREAATRWLLLNFDCSKEVWCHCHLVSYCIIQAKLCTGWSEKAVWRRDPRYRNRPNGHCNLQQKQSFRMQFVICYDWHWNAVSNVYTNNQHLHDIMLVCNNCRDGTAQRLCCLPSKTVILFDVACVTNWLHL